MHVENEHAIQAASASRTGTRAFNCDAAGIWKTATRTTAAVIDGIGNSRAVADSARLLADVAVRVGVHRGGLAGLLSACELLHAPAFEGEAPDAAGVLA